MVDGDKLFKVRKRPMYVIRGAWHNQAPDTNHNFVGWALERLPHIPSVLISETHGCLFFGTPGQCIAVSELRDSDVIGYWGTSERGLVPVYKTDLTHCISVYRKKENPYPKKWDLDAENIIRKVDYKYC